MPDFPEGYASYESWISYMAGASPCEWLPMPDTDWPMPLVPEWSEEESDDPADQ